jgi:pSer/pThr/pTyr-binding forkhead associated (FHA) protein
VQVVATAARTAASLVFPGGLERPLVGELTVGRDRSNSLVIASRTVSRLHARLSEAESRWFVEDRGSANGTLVNGQRIPPHVPIRVRHADRIAVGPQAFVISNPAEAEDPEQTEVGPEVTGVPEQPLSVLQRQVVQILCTEWVRRGTLDRLPTNKEIAERMGTPDAAPTVKAALRRVYAKAGVAMLPPQEKRRALCRVARSRGWI